MNVAYFGRRWLPPLCGINETPAICFAIYSLFGCLTMKPNFGCLTNCELFTFNRPSPTARMHVGWYIIFLVVCEIVPIVEIATFYGYCNTSALQQLEGRIMWALDLGSWDLVSAIEEPSASELQRNCLLP